MARACTVDACTRPHEAKGYCAPHYLRALKSGSPFRTCATCGADMPIRLGTRKYCTKTCNPRTAKVVIPAPCVVCGTVVEPGSGRRKHCSGACQALDSFHHQAPRPRTKDCVACGVEIDLLARGKGGKRRRVDTKLCTPCKRQVHKHDMTVGQLAKRDGLACGICGEDVNLDARHPDPFRPSIDHRKPRSLGGDNSPENLALTHLWCNQVKSNREGFVI